MWWHGRGNISGSWLPEDKKANKWHGRGNSGGSWPPAFPHSSFKIVTEHHTTLCRITQQSFTVNIKYTLAGVTLLISFTLLRKSFSFKPPADHFNLFCNINTKSIYFLIMYIMHFH